MSLQVIKSLNGQDEYILLPVAVYRALQDIIAKKLKEIKHTKEQYVPFALEDYVDNPVALARIRANLTQEELATRLNVSQAYISKLENQRSVSPKVLQKVISIVDKNT